MDLLLIEDDQAYQLAMASHLQQLPGVQQVQVELAVPSLLAGASWWDHTATAALQSAGLPPRGEPRRQGQLLDGLTQREREVLACLAEGENNRAIAQRLGIGEGTVRSHVHVLLQKLQASNRTQAALLWLQTREQDG